MASEPTWTGRAHWVSGQVWETGGKPAPGATSAWDELEQRGGGGEGEPGSDGGGRPAEGRTEEAGGWADTQEPAHRESY